MSKIASNIPNNQNRAPGQASPLSDDEARRPESGRLLNTLSVDQIQALADHLRSNPDLYGSTPQKEITTFSRADLPAGIKPATSEEIANNHRRITALPPHIQDIEKFLPELQKKKPDEVLHILTERFKKTPSTCNGQLLQLAMNRITSCGPVDDEINQAITNAKEAFHKKSKAYPGKTDDVFLAAFTDANFGGASTFTDLSPGWVYYATPYVGDAMNDAISSVIVGCSPNEVGGNAILFENAGFVGKYQNYNFHVTPASGTGVLEEINYVGDNFNDITSSTLIVRRFTNETTAVQLSTLVPQQSILNIVKSQSGVSSAGNATFTWDMWNSDSSKALLWVIVPINVDTGTIFGSYNCQIRYWIYLYVDSNGHLQGYVDLYGCWVQGGWITGDVQNGLMNKIPGTIGQVNQLISQALALANAAGPYSVVYYLPGTNAFNGSTWDDVSIVAVRQ